MNRENEPGRREKPDPKPDPKSGRRDDPASRSGEEPDPQAEPQSDEERRQAGVTREEGAKGAPYGRQTHGGQSYGHEGVAGQNLEDPKDEPLPVEPLEPDDAEDAEDAKDAKDEEDEEEKDRGG